MANDSTAPETSEPDDLTIGRWLADHVIAKAATAPPVGFLPENAWEWERNQTIGRALLGLEARTIWTPLKTRRWLADLIVGHLGTVAFSPWRAFEAAQALGIEPTFEELADLLVQADFAPWWVCDYLAERLRKAAKHRGAKRPGSKGGRPAGTTPFSAFQNLFLTESLAERVVALTASYREVRAPKPHPIDIAPYAKPDPHNCPPSMKLLERCADCGRVRVLLAATSGTQAKDGWQRTGRKGPWKVRSPKALAWRHAVVETGIATVTTHRSAPPPPATPANSTPANSTPAKSTPAPPAPANIAAERAASLERRRKLGK